MKPRTSLLHSHSIKKSFPQSLKIWIKVRNRIIWRILEVKIFMDCKTNRTSTRWSIWIRITIELNSRITIRTTSTLMTLIIMPTFYNLTKTKRLLTSTIIRVSISKRLSTTKYSKVMKTQRISVLRSLKV